MGFPEAFSPVNLPIQEERDRFLSDLGDVIISYAQEVDRFEEFTREQHVAIGSVLGEKIAVFCYGRTPEEDIIVVTNNKYDKKKFDPLENKWNEHLLGSGVEPVVVLDRIDKVVDSVLYNLMSDPRYLYRR